MAAKPRRFEESALLPEEFEATITGTKVKFIEYSRSKLLAFIDECIDLKGQPAVAEGETRRPIKEVGEESLPLINKWLAEATRNAQDADFFEKADLTISATNRLLEAIYDMNHVSEVVLTGGNLLLLPNAFRLAEQDRRNPQAAISPESSTA